jgi:hypothetical protein
LKYISEHLESEKPYYGKTVVYRHDSDIHQLLKGNTAPKPREHRKRREEREEHHGVLV